MEFSIVGLLVIDIVVRFVTFAFLRDDQQDQFCTVQTWFAEMKKQINSIDAGLFETTKNTMEIKAMGLDSDTRRRVEQMLEGAGDRADDETSKSKAMEEGIANLLQYSVGKGADAKL